MAAPDAASPRVRKKLTIGATTMGLAYAMLGGSMAWQRIGSVPAIVIMAMCCGDAGALIGFDYKRRILRIRAAWNRRQGIHPRSTAGEAG